MVRQSLFIVQFPASAPVCQVEDFPKGTARSVDGALHVRPGGTKRVTRTELTHLKKIKPWGPLIRTIKKIVPKIGTPQPPDRVKPQLEAAARVPKGGGTRQPKKVAEGKGKKAGG